MFLSVFGYSSDFFCFMLGVVRIIYIELVIDFFGGGGVGGVCGVWLLGCGGCECSGCNEGYLMFGCVWWVFVG